VKGALISAFLGWAVFASPVSATEPVAVELVLALDCSASVNHAEFALQLQGLAAAFHDPDVIAAVESLKPFGAAVVIMQWGGPGESHVVVPWTHLVSARDAKAFGYLTGLVHRWQRASSTSITTAIEDSAKLLDTNAFDGQRTVIDISGDGPDNGGLDLTAARDKAIRSGITINGLAIEIEDQGLATYYRDRVIGGSGSFVERALDFEDFARAIKDKLLRELRPLQS
jgi:hypothetical protein